ncbi:glycosyltransferase family 9 protein [Compostibacter hankyongensis]|uniref:Glycosyltransferase family 9 protein n=1 Tax=Compostibacter hankyongensis TaxID=1007089 RepID=A0ABP8FHE6_9BACT
MGRTAQQPSTLLVMRFSAMGDVAMTVPVIVQLLQHYPALQVVMVSDKKWAPLFENIPRLTFYPADLRGLHKGFFGLRELYRSLRSFRISAVADLHRVLRSRVMDLFFSVGGYKVSVLDKGRPEKRRLTRKRGKVLQPLRATVQRYADVFAALGFPFPLREDVAPLRPPVLRPELAAKLPEKGTRRWVGIAPFARHPEKTYPPEKMQEIVGSLALREDLQLLLFGGGSAEVQRLEEWAARYPGVCSTAGKYSLEDELAIIGRLSLMISMDSANMHLAALFGVPVISIWGATHPYAGFRAFGQPEENRVQIALYCRPCSVFGNVPCYRGDHACMEQLPPALVLQRVNAVLDGNVS